MAPNARRMVDSHTLVSDSQPAVVVEVAAGFAYVGRPQFILSDVASVDAFVFAVGDEGRPARLLVVQFEGYLESNDHTFDYSFADTILLGNRQFHTDTTVVALSPPPPRGSDMGRVLDLPRRRHYPLSGRATVMRFVYLPDAARRNELLILYAEAVGEGVVDTGFERPVRERALASFTVRLPEPALTPAEAVD